MYSKNILRGKRVNEIKKYIIVFLFVFCFFTGFWARGKIVNDKSQRLLQTAGQQLESARLENIELRKKLELSNNRINNIQTVLERSRDDSQAARNLVRQSKQILEGLIETIQQIENIVYNGDSSFE